MTADEIIAIANKLKCKPATTAVTFARMLAEHCAQLAAEAETNGESAPQLIRRSFHIGSS